MSEGKTSFTFEVDDSVAWELAQFCKRVGFDAAYDLTEAYLSPAEKKTKAYQMLAGVDAVARALADGGVAPR